MTSNGNFRIGMAGIWPYPIGGVATTCFDLSTELSRRGYDVFFIDSEEDVEKLEMLCLREYKLLSSLRLRNIGLLLHGFCGIRGKRIRYLLWKSALEIIKSSFFRGNPKQFIVSLLRIMEIGEWFENRQVDVLHGHHAGLLSWQVLMVARYLLSCPFVVTVYASEFTMQSKSYMLPVAVDVCNRADAIMCISKYTMTRMQRAGVQNSRTLVIYLACRQEHYRRTEEDYREIVRRKLGLSPLVPTILYTGWLIERKGPQVLMEALRQVVDVSWQAVFVGPDRGLFRKLEDMVNDLGISERVRVSKAVDRSDLLALYDLCDVFVFPTLSQDEGFGLVGLEAMAHGKPVIASRTGAIPEVISDAGLYFDPGDSVQLANYIRKLLVDENMRREMSVAALRRSQEFDWSKTALNVETLYTVAIGRYWE